MALDFDAYLKDCARKMAAMVENAVPVEGMSEGVILLAYPEQIAYRLRCMGFEPGIGRIPERAFRTAMEGATVAIVNVAWPV